MGSAAGDTTPAARKLSFALVLGLALEGDAHARGIEGPRQGERLLRACRRARRRSSSGAIMTGMALAWIGRTISFAAQVRMANTFQSTSSSL